MNNSWKITANTDIVVTIINGAGQKAMLVHPGKPDEKFYASGSLSHKECLEAKELCHDVAGITVAA